MHLGSNSLTLICYCPSCNVITDGLSKEHYCEGSIELGYLEESYVEMLERRYVADQYMRASYQAAKLLYIHQQTENDKLKEKLKWWNLYESYTGISDISIKKETKRLMNKYKRKFKC